MFGYCVFELYTFVSSILAINYHIWFKTSLVEKSNFKYKLFTPIRALIYIRVFIPIVE